jgi:hypothetical protein
MIEKAIKLGLRDQTEPQGDGFADATGAKARRKIVRHRLTFHGRRIQSTRILSVNARTNCTKKATARRGMRTSTGIKPNAS